VSDGGVIGSPLFIVHVVAGWPGRGGPVVALQHPIKSCLFAFCACLGSICVYFFIRVCVSPCVLNSHLCFTSLSVKLHYHDLVLGDWVCVHVGGMQDSRQG
jgi:hypothetical protein